MNDGMNDTVPDRRAGRTHSRVLCVWLPNWPVQRIQAAEPRLANSPLVLSARDARRGLLVAAANLAARAAGIRPSMRLSEATALVDTEIREHDSHEDMDTLCTLTEGAQQFSPIVGLEQLDKKLWAGRTIHQPESLLLDVTGLAGIFGGEGALMRQVSQWLSSLHYFGCMAIASSVGAAWAMANYGTRRLPQQVPQPPSEAMAVPECRCYTAPAGDWEAMEALPLSALRLSPETINSLRRLGLQRIGQLQHLPRAGMATRLGETLLLRWDQAMGLKEEPIVTLHALPDWNIEQTLEIPTENRETIVELVRRLSGELAQRLSRRGEGALRIVCRLDLVKRQPLLMQLGLFRPTNDAQHLEMLLVGQLEQQLRGLPNAPLWQISMQATLTSPLVWRQTDLFNSGAAAGRNEIARLVDTLSCRLGRKQVLSAKVRRESQPELASSFLPMTGRRNDGSEQATVKKLSSRLAQKRAEPSRDDPLRRPTHLFNSPIAIEVTGTWQASSTNSMPEQVEQRSSAAAPSKIKYRNAWHSIVDACGPERLESGWWKGPSARRDYFRVITSKGSWWWIYRDLNKAAWYLHGMFD